MPADLPTSSEAVGGPFPVDLYSLQGDIGDGIVNPSYTSSGWETNESSSPSEILHQTLTLDGASPLSNSHVQHLSSRTIDML
ncbi:hypothetical protein GB937_008959 [Aspergillus fischeri]|nr:hypothetical protein GB937_008959 [Aspergillus fischeri]